MPDFVTAGKAPLTLRLLRRLDALGHALHVTWIPGFWRICDAYDVSLGTPDTPENFPRRWHRFRRVEGK